MRLPFTSCTITVTRGSRTSGDSLSCTLFSSCPVVRPSAGRSPRRGSVIFPSGLTGTVRDRSGSFQTETSTTSSLASRYSCTTCCASSCWDTPLCAQPGPNASSAAAGPHHHLQLTDIECLLRHGRTGGSRAGPGARRVPDRRALKEAHCVFPADDRGRAARRFCASRPVALRCVPHEWKRRSHSRGTGGSGDALALQRASLGPFEEPLLLLSMGTLFLLFGKLLAPHTSPRQRPAEPDPEPTPHLLPHREARH